MPWCVLLFVPVTCDGAMDGAICPLMCTGVFCIATGANRTFLSYQEPTGGRVFVFNMNLPIAEGKGQLRNRDDQKALGTDRVCAGKLNSYAQAQWHISSKGPAHAFYLHYSTYSLWYITKGVAMQEAALLKPNGEFYTELGKAMSKAGISVDMFLFPTSYTDVSTLGMKVCG